MNNKNKNPQREFLLPSERAGERNIVDQGILTKRLLEKNATGELRVSADEKQSVSGAIEGEPLDLLEYSVLCAIAAMFHEQGLAADDELKVSASQIYNKIRNGAGAGKVHFCQQEEIKNILLGLRRFITIDVTAECADELGVDAHRFHHCPLLNFTYDEDEIRGKKSKLVFRVQGRSALQRLSLATGQMETVPQDVLAVQQKDENGLWKPWTLSNKRIRIRTALEIFCYQYLRNSLGCVNRKSYASIWKLIPEIKLKRDEEEAKKDVAVILDWWVHLGLIDKWKEYGDGRGVQIQKGDTALYKS